MKYSTRIIVISVVACGNECLLTEVMADLKENPRGSQLGLGVYEELISNGIFLYEFYVHTRIFRPFGGVLLVKISKFVVNLGEKFGILRTFFKEF